MRNKVAKIIAIVLILIFGGTYIYNKLTKPNLGPKTTKLYQHGFRLLEEPTSKNTIEVLKRLNFPQYTLLRKGQHSQMRTCVQLFMISMEIRLL